MNEGDLEMESRLRDGVSSDRLPKEHDLGKMIACWVSSTTEGAGPESLTISTASENDEIEAYSRLIE